VGRNREKPNVLGVILLLKLGLVLVFTVAGVTKLLDRPGTRRAVQEFSVPAPLAPALAWLLPLSELAIAALLLTGGFAWWGALAALVSLGLFNAAIGVNLAQGRRPDCHCFGQLHSAPIGWSTLGRNFALMAAAGGVLWAGGGASLLELLAERLAHPDGGFLLALTGLAAVGVEGWLLYQAARQNLRLTQRVELLESRLNSGGIGAVPHLGGTPAAPPAGLPVGLEAPFFELPTIHGEMQSLDSYLDLMRPVILVFMSPSCGSCKELVPELIAWHESLGDRFTILLVSSAKQSRNGEQFAQYGKLPLLLQKDAEVLRRYEGTGTPSAVLIRADGTIGSELASGARGIRALVANADAELERTFRPLLEAATPLAAAEPETLHPGASAPPFELPDAAGGVRALSHYAGRAVLLVFFSPTCGYCTQMIPEVAAYGARASARDPQLVVVATGSAEENRRWVEEHGVECPVLLLGSTDLRNQYRIPGTPAGYLIDAEGRIASELAVGAEPLFALAAAEEERAVMSAAP
jgi:peroxiredoxin/uncharacterized membrane protein YphA (DoxX/SURF4 family)